MFTPDQMQVHTQPKIKISDTELHLVRNPKLLGLYMDTFFSFNAHCVQVANRVSKSNEALRIITGSHKMSTIDHLHSETKMPLVEDHLSLLSAQYLVHCLYTDHV